MHRRIQCSPEMENGRSYLPICSSRLSTRSPEVCVGPRSTCYRALCVICLLPPLLTAGHTVRACTGPDTDRSQVAEVAGADSKGAAGSVAAVQVEKSTVVGTLCDCSMDSVMTALCKFTLQTRSHDHWYCLMPSQIPLRTPPPLRTVCGRHHLRRQPAG